MISAGPRSTVPEGPGSRPKADLPVARQGCIEVLDDAHRFVDKLRRGAFGDADERRVSRESQQEAVGK